MDGARVDQYYGDPDRPVPVVVHVVHVEGDLVQACLAEDRWFIEEQSTTEVVLFFVTVRTCPSRKRDGDESDMLYIFV